MSKGQSPENAWAEAAVKELKIRTCDLVQPETTWKDAVGAQTGQGDATASAKSVADAGAEACEVDQFGQSMARGHLLEIFGAEVGTVRVREMASRQEGRSSWCVKETLGTCSCCCLRGTVRSESRECAASSFRRASSTPVGKSLHQDADRCRNHLDAETIYVHASGRRSRSGNLAQTPG